MMSLDQTPINQLITDHIDVWTSTVKTKSTTGRGSSKKLDLYGVKKLRELILELAVRGKLVPQDPSDEPASVLLERIAEEKAQLVNEKKLKKQKELPAISDDELPYSIPKNWVWCRLDDICFGITSGSTPPKSNFNESEGIPYLKVYNIRDQKVDFDYKPQFVDLECHATKLKRSSLYPGDVIMNIVGPPLGKVAIISNDYPEWNCNQAITFFRPIEPSLNTYIYTYLRAGTFLRSIDLIGTAGQDNISVTKSRSILLPTPPLEEQHRIVAKVDELMTLCDQLEQQTEASIAAHQVLVTTLLDTLTNSANAEELMQNWQMVAEHFDTLFTTEESIDQLKQTILQLAVMGKLVPQDPNDEPAAKLLERIAEEKAQLIKDKKIKKQKALPPIADDEKPFGLPNGWEWCHLNSIISIMDAGWSPACPPEASPNNDTWGVLKTTAVQNMEYWEHENKVLASSKEPRPQYEVKKGDILITRAGPKNRVGVSCLVQETRPKLMISDKIIRFHLVEVGMSENYVSLCLNAGATAAHLESAKSGMAESQMNISQDKLKVAPVPLAPIKEQLKIISKVEELLEFCEQLKVRLRSFQTTQLHLTDAIVDQAV